jgi:hypothetical protein
MGGHLEDGDWWMRGCVDAWMHGWFELGDCWVMC